MSKGIPLHKHFAALRKADLRRQADLRAADQRALAIKEVGDAKALDLAREIQTYKDEKANELRTQIGDERGRYVTQEQFAPVRDFMTSQAGKGQGIGQSFAAIVQTISSVGMLLTVIYLILRGVHP